MALSDNIIDRARSLANDPDSFTIYSDWLENLEDSFGFNEGTDDSEELAFVLIALSERYGNSGSLKELREIKKSLEGPRRVTIPVSTKRDLPLREWLILFVSAQLARRLR